MADLVIRVGSIVDPTRRTFRFRTVAPDNATPFGVRLWMNSRSFRWGIDVLDSAGRPLIQGHALCTRTDVLEPYRPFYGDLLPPGQLFVQDTQGGDNPTGPEAWRERWILSYRPEEDVGPETEPRVV